MRIDRDADGFFEEGHGGYEPVLERTDGIRATLSQLERVEAAPLLRSCANVDLLKDVTDGADARGLEMTNY